MREVVVRALRRQPAVWSLARAVRQRANTLLPERHIDGIPGPIHRNDTMVRATGPERYYPTAVQTVDLFADRAEAAGVDLATSTWLEIGCGYGRLVRALVARAAPHRVWGCDVDPDAVRFCSRAFGIHPVLSDTSFRFDPPVRADVVFALSVATHLPWDGFERFLAAAFGSVEPGGVVLFSTHGAVSLGQLGAYDGGAYVPMEAHVRAGFDSEHGFAYVPYGFEPSGSYGMAWHRPDAVRRKVEAAARRAGGGEVGVEEAAIEGHQDLWVCRVRA